MLKHEQIWQAIDALAARNGLSASGLARRAGLDPTTFNRSKRLTPDGRQRWPSTESVAKILIATNETLDNFVGLISAQDVVGGPRLPSVSLSEAAAKAAFSARGTPSGEGWDEIALPCLQAPGAFAIEIDSVSGSALYREGTVLVACVGVPVRRADRIAVRLKTGRVVIGEVKRETTSGFDLAGTQTSGDVVSIRHDDIDWIARIHWASQ